MYNLPALQRRLNKQAGVIKPYTNTLCKIYKIRSLVKMEYSKKQIAELFSNGKFEEIIGFLSEGIVWNVVGEKTYKGKKTVTENCQQTAEYFKSVQADFITDEVIVSENKVIVIGTAEFKRNGKRVNYISSCDIYVFNNKNEIEKISSYCIPDKQA